MGLGFARSLAVDHPPGPDDASIRPEPSSFDSASGDCNASGPADWGAIAPGLTVGNRERSLASRPASLDKRGHRDGAGLAQPLDARKAAPGIHELDRNSARVIVGAVLSILPSARGSAPRLCIKGLRQGSAPGEAAGAMRRPRMDPA